MAEKIRFAGWKCFRSLGPRLNACSFSRRAKRHYKVHAIGSQPPFRQLHRCSRYCQCCDRRDPRSFGRLESWTTDSLNKILHERFERVTRLEQDMRNLMTGAPNHIGMTIVDILTSGGFLGPDRHFQTLLQEKEERYLFALAVKFAWRFDRPYILEVDAPLGSKRDIRGHSNCRICPPEHPKKRTTS
jgi:hypothetical protein